MSTAVLDYNLGLIQITLGDFRVTGFSADDACTIAPMSDAMESEPSTDGSHVVISRVNDNRYEMMLKVRRGSAGFRQISDAMVAQFAAADVGAVPSLAFTLYDPVSGDKVTARAIRFLRAPDMGAGKAAPTAEFKILLPNPSITYGGNIAVSA